MYLFNNKEIIKPYKKAKKVSVISLAVEKKKDNNTSNTLKHRSLVARARPPYSGAGVRASLGLLNSARECD